MIPITIIFVRTFTKKSARPISQVIKSTDAGGVFISQKSKRIDCNFDCNLKETEKENIFKDDLLKVKNLSVFEKEYLEKIMGIDDPDIYLFRYRNV